ncbi:hypothetical protein MP228_005983 [Amoeboaphelidium protococcarum]|nr:hypothetical protein MP228_005983 [Amoeboaphelidium protococcarum]
MTADMMVFVEVLKNILKLNIIVWGAGVNADVSNLKLKLVGHRLMLIDGSDSIMILDDMKTLSIVSSTAKFNLIYHELRIQIEIASDISALEYTDCMVSENQCLGMLKQCTSMNCIKCRLQLTPPERSRLFNKARLLPPEYWHELIECWVCHPKEDLKKVQEFDAHARSGAVLVAGSRVLMHVDDLDASAISLGDADNNGFLSCKQCGYQFAKSQQFERNGEQGIEVSIDISQVLIRIQNSTEYKISQLQSVLLRMRELYDAHNDSKFALCSETETEALEIWILQWDSLINFSKQMKLVSSPRIFYRKGNLIDLVNHLEIIKVAPDQLQRVKQDLDKSNHQLPSSVRQMFGYSVAFLNVDYNQ